MTEEGAISMLKWRIETASKIAGKGADGKAFEDLEMAIQALEEIQAYRAIGEHRQVAEWLEELKEARKGFNENRKAGYKHGYSDGYAKAIDDFTEKLMTDVESFVAEVNGIRADLLTLDYFCEFVGDTAEQMKGENNGQRKSS